MIPAPILAAVAPLIVDAITKPKGKAKEGLLGDAIESGEETLIGQMISATASNETEKASVRPRTMRQVWWSTVMTKIAYIGIAAAPGLGTGMTIEASEHALGYLLYLLGGQVGYLGYAHGTRTVEKMKGKS